MFLLAPDTVLLSIIHRLPVVILYFYRYETQSSAGKNKGLQRLSGKRQGTRRIADEPDWSPVDYRVIDQLLKSVSYDPGLQQQEQTTIINNTSNNKPLIRQEVSTTMTTSLNS